MQERSDKNQPLFYQILGPEVAKDRIPLYELIESLREYLYIIDRSYLMLTGSKRLSKKEREKYKIVSTATKNDGNIMKNGQERRGKDSGAPSRSLASS